MARKISINELIALVDKPEPKLTPVYFFSRGNVKFERSPYRDSVPTLPPGGAIVPNPAALSFLSGGSVIRTDESKILLDQPGGVPVYDNLLVNSEFAAPLSGDSDNGWRVDQGEGVITSYVLTLENTGSAAAGLYQHIFGLNIGSQYTFSIKAQRINVNVLVALDTSDFVFNTGNIAAELYTATVMTTQQIVFTATAADLFISIHPNSSLIGGKIAIEYVRLEGSV